MAATSAIQTQTEHPLKCLIDAEAGIYQDFSLLNIPGFLCFAIADYTLANTKQTLPNFTQTLPFFLNAQFYAVSGADLPNGLRLLQHLPCINSFSCGPVHTPPS